MTTFQQNSWTYMAGFVSLHFTNLLTFFAVWDLVASPIFFMCLPLCLRLNDCQIPAGVVDKCKFVFTPSIPQTSLHRPWQCHVHYQQYISITWLGLQEAYCYQNAAQFQCGFIKMICTCFILFLSAPLLHMLSLLNPQVKRDSTENERVRCPWLWISTVKSSIRKVSLHPSGMRDAISCNWHSLSVLGLGKSFNFMHHVAWILDHRKL